MTLHWTIDPAGVAPTGFALEGGGQPGEVLASVPTGSAALAFTFTAPSGSFYVRLHALNGSARSPASNEIYIHVNVPIAPSAPANLLGLVNGSSLALAWTNTYTGGAHTSLVLDVTGSITASIPLGLSDSFAFAGVPRHLHAGAARTECGRRRRRHQRGDTHVPRPLLGSTADAGQRPRLSRGEHGVHRFGPRHRQDRHRQGYTVNVTGSYVGTVATAGRALNGTVGFGSYTLTVAAANTCGPSAPSAPQTVVVP